MAAERNLDSISSAKGIRERQLLAFQRECSLHLTG